MKTRKLKNSEYMLMALFAFIAAFPLATSTDGLQMAELPLASVLNNVHLAELTAWTVLGL